MENIKTSVDLKEAIQQLEFEHTIREHQLKEQLLLAHESLNPVNLIKNALSEVASSPYLVDNILSASVALATGYISKIVTVGSADNKFKKFLGIILQFGVTKIVAQNTDTLKSVGQFIYQQFVHKKEMNSKNS